MFLRAPRILHYDYLASAMSSSACQVCFQPSSKVLNAGVCIDLSISSCGIPRFIQCRYIYTDIYTYIYCFKIVYVYVYIFIYFFILYIPSL